MGLTGLAIGPAFIVRLAAEVRLQTALKYC